MSPFLLFLAASPFFFSARRAVELLFCGYASMCVSSNYYYGCVLILLHMCAGGRFSAAARIPPGRALPDDQPRQELRLGVPLAHKVLPLLSARFPNVLKQALTVSLCKKRLYFLFDIKGKKTHVFRMSLNRH